jgi:putative flippase GtrA
MSCHPSVQALRFALVGGGATVTHVAVALLLAEAGGWTPLWANFAAFCCAFSVSYRGNHGWTFAMRGAHRHHFPRFAVVALLGLALNQSIVALVVGELGWSYRLALALVVLVVPAATFALNRWWVFAAPDSSRGLSGSGSIRQ